jgi:GAF domain-containing protein
MTTADNSTSRELYFLYELAKVFASSIDLAEVTEYVLDGTCALLGAEQGFVYLLDSAATLAPHAGRGLAEDDLRTLAGRLQPVIAESKALAVEHPRSIEGQALAAPLVAHNQVVGLFGVATAYARRFTPEEQERLASVANLASLALENARLHERAQRELAMLRRLIHAAQAMGAGEMTQEQAAAIEAEFKGMLARDELSGLVRAFGQMAREVIRREENLKRQVAELNIQIDVARKARQVAEITETQYFQSLRKRARELRGKG